MVISKPTSVVHPRPTVKESLMTNVGSATLPKVRSVTRRVAELPSLRYGPVGAGCSVSGPLRIRDPGHQPTIRKYVRNFTTGMLGTRDAATAVTSIQPRRVRFALPPPEDASDATPSRCPTTTYSVSHPPPVSKRTSPSPNPNQARPQPVQAVTVVSGTTPVTQRVHAASSYIRGTLSPTTHAAATLAGAPGALVRAVRDGDENAATDLMRSAVRTEFAEREINAVDSSGRTALSYIASNGSIELLETILQFPALDPNVPDNEGNTPLHFAAQAGQVECLNFLLSRCQGLEIDARNHLGFTPLMKAALQGRNKCAKLLLFAGANPTLRDTGRGLRAEQWARFCGRYVCADVIEKFARHRLLERSTSCGRWGSDTDIGATRVILGKIVPMPTQQIAQPQGIKSKLRKVFRTSSGPSHPSESSSARLVTQLTSAALCASSPVLPAAPTVPPVVKSLIRPLTVPRLQITLANGAATLASQELHGMPTLSEHPQQTQHCGPVEKPPRIKKKMK